MSSIAHSSQPGTRSLLPSWLKGKWGILGIFFIIYILIDLAWTYFHWGGSQHVRLISDLLSLAPSLLASILAWRVAAQKSLGKSLRRAWLLLGISLLMFFIGDLVWAYLEVVLHVEPFPSLADVFYLTFYPFGLWGLLSMPSGQQNRRERLTFWLDLFSVLIAATMFVGYFIIVPTAATSGNSLLTQLIASAYPIGSLLLTGGILAILYRRPSPDSQSAFSLLLMGMLCFVGADFAFGYTSLNGTYTPGGWTDVGWNVAQLFFALATLRQIVHTPTSTLRQHRVTLRNRFTKWFPLIAVALVYGLIFYVAITNNIQAAIWLIDGALLLTLLLVVRQIISPNFVDLPVRVKMILTFILVSVLSVILVFAAAYSAVRSNLEAVVGDSLKTDVEFRAQSLGNELSKQLDLLEGFVLGETFEHGAAAANAHYPRDRAAIETRLQEQAQAWKAADDANLLVQDVLYNRMAAELYEFRDLFPSNSDLLLTDQYGATIASTTRPASYSQSAEDWWQGAYEQGRGAVYIGQPTFDPATRTLQIIIAVPLHAHRRSEVIGVLRSTYQLQNILEMLAFSQSETQGGFDLLLPGGQLLHPRGALDSLGPEEAARLQASLNADYAQLSFEGKLQLLSQAPVFSSDPDDAQIFKTLDWSLIAHKEPTVAFAPLLAAWQTALLTLLFVLFLTTGVAVILAQVLIAPITRLTGVAAQIAAGDFTVQAQVESRDEIGTLAGTFNMMVGALSQTQQELQESEALYRNLVEYSPDMIAVYCYGKYVFINPAGAKLMGAKGPDEIIGKDVLEMLPEEDRELVRQGLEMVTALSEPAPFQQRKLHYSNGSGFEAEFRASSITFAGQPAIQFVARDITERKRLEEQWHNFKLGIECSSEAVFMTDAAGVIRYINPAFENMYGYLWDEAVGQTPRILKSGTLSQDTYRHFWETLLAGGTVSGEIVNRTSDGRLINIEGSNNPILDESGHLIGFLAVHRDVTERKQAEMKLQMSEERFRSLFENMLSGYAYCQMLYDQKNQPEDFIYISVNDSFEKITGLRNVAGRKVSEVIPGIQKSNPELLEIYGRVAQTCKPERFETHIDSLGIWFSISVYSPKKDHFVAVFDNITERKRAEEQIHRLLAEVEAQKEDLEVRVAERTEELNVVNRRLQEELAERQRLLQSLGESEQRFRTVFDTSPDAIFLIDPHDPATLMKIDDCNQAACRMNGYTRQELIGQSMGMLNVQKESWDEFALVMENLRQGSPMASHEAEHFHKDGHVFPIEYATSLITAGGRELVLGIDRDITERKRSEEALRLSEEKYRNIFENVQDVFYTTDYQGYILTISPSIEKHSGFRPDEILGKHVRTFFINEENYENLNFAVARQGMLNDYEMVMKRKDGSSIYVSVTARVVFDDNGQPIRTEGVMRDITERKQAEEALSQAKDAAEASQRVAEAANRAKSEFLSRMSHELRTPMNAILGFAQLLEMSRKEPLTSMQKERVKQIVKGGQHLLGLINEILDISRIEANRLQISPEPVSVREGIQEALDLTVPLAIKRQIQIVTKLGGMDVNPFVMADRQRFKQVLLNLLGNAVKYNREEGSVIITCQQTPSNNWRISITDTGPGISQENLARLFVPFERLGVDQPNVEGTGLGLVLAKRLVEMMHGQIGVESTFGRGSTFWIELPVTENPLERLQRTGGTGEMPELSSTARTILYVEDNVANFELIKQVLADYRQIELLWATEPKAAIEAARRRQPSLILLDLHLGLKDGADILRQLKRDEGTAGIPVVVVSADATSGQAKRLIALGAHTYLTKPLDVRHFVQLVEELLSEKEV